MRSPGFLLPEFIIDNFVKLSYKDRQTNIKIYIIMDGVSIILMLLTTLLAFKATGKIAENVKARDIVNRRFLVYALLVLIIWWVFDKFSLPENYFWRGVSSGIILWTMSQAMPLAEKIGDLPGIIRTETAAMLLSVPVWTVIAILLCLPVRFVFLLPSLWFLGAAAYFIIRNKIRARKYQKELETDYAVLRKENNLKRLKEEISSITDMEILKRAIVKSKQRLLPSGKRCDCGNCRNAEGLCRYQTSVKLQSNNYIRGCEQEQFILEQLLHRKEELKAAKQN